MSKKGSNIYKRKDGRWEGRLYFSGSRKYKSVYGKTYTEAKKRLRELNAEKDTAKCMSMFSDIAMQWLEYRRCFLKESTYSCYFTKLSAHVIPYFKGMKYDSVTAEAVADFVSRKIREGYSEKYVSDILVMLKTVAKWAFNTYGYRNGLLNFPAVKASKSEPQLLDRNQQKKLQDCLMEEENATNIGILLAMYTGIRIGELCALKWGDFNFEENYFAISKTVQRISQSGEGAKTKIIITQPKTPNSIRIIPIPQFLISPLKRLRQSEECYFLSGNEKLTEPRCMTYRFKKLLKKAGVPSVRFHSLRHTFATNCLRTDSFDIKTLSEILGHSGADVTMKIYVHSSLERKKLCMSRIKPIP